MNPFDVYNAKAHGKDAQNIYFVNQVSSRLVRQQRTTAVWPYFFFVLFVPNACTNEQPCASRSFYAMVASLNLTKLAYYPCTPVPLHAKIVSSVVSVAANAWVPTGQQPAPHQQTHGTGRAIPWHSTVGLYTYLETL